ncbi:hypothetical protein GCM10023194_27180 [Planotetraspora phitsanulokensis]|uniref:Uncharacterized protein n=1 Tax=Planotetraspora phitsanulokensis TaxID=575192 RepID=A0A8J3U0R4_9ACTN|nr:hypothetical protein Pph01_11480 [Planotetraspora phitsanulokensis]
MGEPIEIPPPVLNTFDLIRALVDMAVEVLKESARPEVPELHQVFDSDTGTATDVVGAVHMTVTAHMTVSAEVQPAMLTVPEVKMARAWLRSAKPALMAANLLVLPVWT